MKYLECAVPEKTAYIIPIGDLHRGDKSFGKESLEKLNGYLEWVKARPNARIFLNGDIFNVASRVSKTSPFETDTTEYQDVVEIFRPYADRIIGANDGNHCSRMYDMFGISPLQNFCMQLKIPYCKYSACVRLKVGKRKNSNRWLQNYFLYYHHTSGGGSTMGSKLNRVVKLKEIIEGIDVYFGCYSEDTEVLTKEGWKTFDNISVNENVMTLNTDKDLLEYNKVKEVFNYESPGELLRIKGKSIDALVTENHRILYKNTSNRKGHKYFHKWMYKEAKDFVKMKGQLLIPLAGTQNLPEAEMSDDTIKLIAWLISEGHFRKNGSVNIYQDDRKVDKIIEILNSLGIKHSIYKYNNIGREFTIDGKTYATKNLYNSIYIKKMESEEKILPIIINKLVPTSIYSLSDRQFDIFVDTICDGDGHKKYDGVYSYFSNDKELLDQLQELCVRHGYRTSIIKRKRGFNISINKKNSLVLRSKKTFFKEKYNGKVWCVKVKNSNIVVRRNGKTFICGNSHNHQLATGPQNIYYPSVQGGIKKRKVWFVDCGGYLEWEDGYAEKGQLVPATIGSPTVRFDSNKHNVSVSL